LSNIKVSYLPVRYGYTKKKISTSSCNVAYGYTSPSEQSFDIASIGFKAPATQAILNNLPQWMEMRKNTSSNGWKLTNSWGQNLEHIVDITKTLVQEQFLATADATQRSSLYSFSVSNRELLENTTFNNLLFNSSFSAKGPVRTGMPAGWVRYNSGDRNSTYLIYDRSYITSGSMVVESSGTFGQSINFGNTLVKDIAGSCYFLASSPDSQVSLVLVAETIDGKAISSETNFSGQSQQWQRLSSVLHINSKVFRFHFVIHSNSQLAVIFNAPKLEIASEPGRWCKSQLDGLSYIDSASNFSQVCAVSG